ncbi:MAG: VanZ family protein [Lachnospiraceae bacterium]|nr:VanZ family protein [Lachnospiraceae bacterium]
MKRYVTTAVKISMVLYIAVLFLLLFVRHRGSWWMDLTPWEYARMHMNLIPFRTIGGYIKAIFDGSMNLNIPLENLFGNLLMFLPMGCYLPFFIRKIDSLKKYLWRMFPIFFSIEIAQFLTKRGSFDIDDLILNLLGAILGYILWRSRFVQGILAKLNQ